ncbi:MAG: ATP-dependent DNA helicase RecG [Spirochaetia bacterium]|nr:ATP-dependent DNA helicase RecG [Spirochaetia bacterium]
MYLRELRQPVSELKGVGKSTFAAYTALGIKTWCDLLLHLPRSYEDRRVKVPLRNGYSGKPVNTIVEVISHQYIGIGRNRTLKVIIADESGPASLVCFGRNFLQDLLQIERKFYLYGNFSVKYHELQSSSFEVEPYIPDQKPKLFGSILPIYPLSGRLTQNTLRRDITGLLNTSAKHIQDELPESLRRTMGLMTKYEALHAIHFPNSHEDRELARKTLAYEELLFLQLIVRRRALRRQTETPRKNRVSISAANHLTRKLIDSLPFTLTADQVSVLNEIKTDLFSARPMARLIQGDVGSGKTLTAFISALEVIDQDVPGQAAFMAPTELLARQHAENAARFLEPLGIRLAYLTGSVPQSQRKLILKALAEGDIDLIIGTHALFSKDVVFKRLRYVIVDEQHRFGVLQRIALLNKGDMPDLLLMTATPIPRTLALTVFGDLDVSSIHTMPPGRLPVKTYLAAEKSRERVYAAVKVEFERGHQAYFVYPRIDDTGNSDLRDAETMFDYLTKKVYPGLPAGLIHSRIPEDEKLSIMDRFRRGELVYLVATSVVEVGVDVPNAACMIIEHAERFGLSALHQLRGRVGRGTAQSYAFLIYSDALSPEGRARLLVMKESNDGFVIAEKDLSIRGPGEIAGIRQSGFLKLVAADLVLDHELLTQARKTADLILSKDPGLLSLENTAFREVLSRCPPFDEELTDG